MESKKLLMILGDYVEDYEVMVPFQALTMLGYEVHTVCPDKKVGEKVRTAIHDFEGEQTYSEKPGHYFILNYDFTKVNVANYKGLIIPGGRAPEYLRLNKQVIQIIKDFANVDKPIAAICHGPQLLAAAGILTNKKCSAFSTCEPEIRLGGGIYQTIEIDKAIIDGNLVTAPAWPAHPAWLAKFIKLLGASISI